jgi:hypothetical protein
MSQPIAVLLPFALSLVLPAQGLSLTVGDGAGGVAGSICGPWNCVPSPLSVPAGTNLSIEIGARWHVPLFLLAALPPAQCTALPGFGGSLILQPPAVAVLVTPTSLTHHFISWGPGGPTGYCTPFTTSSTLQLPPGLPTGGQLLLQAFGPDYVFAPDPLAFSNAVLLNIL